MRSTRFAIILRPQLAVLSAGLLGIMVALLIAIIATPNPTQPPVDMGYGFPVPASVEELTQQAQVIVVGRIGPMVQQGTFAGYDNAGSLLAPTNRQAQGVPSAFVDYEVRVERVLKDDGTLKRQAPLILRMPGNRTTPIDPDDEYPMSAPGDQHLLFLSQNPDRTTYGLYFGAWSRISIDRTVATASNGQRTPVRFGGQTWSPSAFMAEVMRASHAP